MINKGFGIFELDTDTVRVLVIKRGKSDLLKNKRPPNKWMRAGVNIWLYLYFNFIISPLLMLVVIILTGPGSEGQNYGTLFICLLMSWFFLKAFVNVGWPFFKIRLDINTQRLYYRSSRLSPGFFSWKKEKSIAFEDIASVSYEYSMNSRGRENYYTGLYLYLLIHTTDGKQIPIIHHNTYCHNKTILKSLLKKQNEKSGKNQLNPDVYADFKEAAVLLAERMGKPMVVGGD